MLRDLVRLKHEEAENHPFVKALFGGNLTTRAYAEFLYNQLIIYRALENSASEKGILLGIENIRREEKIKMDLEFFAQSDLKIYNSTNDYVDYISNQPADKLMAHIYVRHMGDLFGGSMIKKVVPGPCNMYEFENRSELIQEIRSRLHIDMADEANTVFDFAISLFNEVASGHNL